MRSVTCAVPPGAGAANAVIFYRGSKSNFVETPAGALALAYQPPAVTAVSPRRVPTEGGTVRLEGRNFGAAAARATVKYGGAAGAPGGLRLWPDPASYGHTHMEVEVPPGDGTGQPLVVSIAGQVPSPTMGPLIPTSKQIYKHTKHTRSIHHTPIQGVGAGMPGAAPSAGCPAAHQPAA